MCFFNHPKAYYCSHFSTVDSTFQNVRASDSFSERIDPNPQQGEDGSQENRPDHNNSRSPVLSPHQTLEEWVQVNNHPKRKEQLTKKRSPRLVSTVDGVRESRNNSHEVDDQQRRRRNQKRCPFEQVELREVSVFV